ncbi:MAG: hypothetical protein GY774_00865 [Planctomycetes bacterium]|nr:hypothetical protein [Planctomycetota bacterium]|tara:strand:+ start:2144 stop:3520 length:1377 start_codon:yes stop_codon:yes gene_type:complete
MKDVNEFINRTLKPVIASIRSNQVLFAIHLNDEDPAITNAAFDGLSTIVKRIHKYIVDNAIDVTDPEFRTYTKSKDLPDTEYFCFAPHINVGQSPFMVHEFEGELRGVFVRMRRHTFTYCTKTIRKLEDAYYEMMYRQDEAVSGKEAKEYIKNRLQGGNQDNVPLIEKVGVVTFYIDLQNQRALAKSGHRDQDGMDAFFSMLIKLANHASERGEGGMEALRDRALGNRYFIVPYTNFMMKTNQAFGSYNLSQMVEFYSAQEESKEKTPDCPLEPTWSGNFSAKDKTACSAVFKNSINFFMSGLNRENPPPTTFTMLNTFAKDKEMNVSQLSVIGEIPLGELLAKYAEEFPEQADDVLKAKFIDMNYVTQSKDGNICIQVKDELKYHKEALGKFLRDEFYDTAHSKKDVEKVTLAHTGKLLAVLHDSIDMFVQIYKDCNPATGFTDEKSDMEKALQEAS